MRIRTLFAVACVLCASVAFATPAAHAATHYENYLGRFCSTTTPPSNCGSYQMLVNLADMRVNDYLSALQGYGRAEQERQIRQVQISMESIINNYPEGETKFLAVYYHVRLYQYLMGNSLGSSNLLGYFFDDVYTTNYSSSSSSYSYTTRNTYADGELDNVWSTSRYTVVDNSSKDITLRNATMSLGVRALGRDGGIASKSAGYQVVAVLDSSASKYDNKTYNASYNSSSNYWSLSAAIGSYSPRKVTLYLLAEDAGGTKFNKGSSYKDWTVVDTLTYDIRRQSNYSDYYDDRYYDDRYYDDRYYDDNCDDRYYYCDDYYDTDRRSDLGIRSVNFDWEYDRGDVVVELTTVIRNYGRYETSVNSLDYHVEVDGDSLRTNEYDERIIEVDCDGSSSRTRIEDVLLDTGDECEVRVELTFDERDVDNETMDIEVELDAHGDNNSANDTRTVSFRIR